MSQTSSIPMLLKRRTALTVCAICFHWPLAQALDIRVDDAYIPVMPPGSYDYSGAVYPVLTNLSSHEVRLAGLACVGAGR